MSIIKVNEIQNVAGTQNKGVLQVVSATKVDVFTTSSATMVDITGLTVTLTPRSTDSKVLILSQCQTSVDTNGYESRIQLVRAISGGATTNIAINTDTTRKNSMSQITTNNYEMSHVSAFHLDSPSTTSAITYHLEASSDATICINRKGNNTDLGGTSNITAMEIQG